MNRLQAILLCLVIASCSPAGDAYFVGKTSTSARDHIMFVRQTPPSFGFQRLQALSNMYPDLGVFVRSEGLPDFMAETSKGGNRFLILYFLQKRQAFVVRTVSSRSRAVEFSGPYPITERENKILGDLRKRAENPPTS